MFRSHCSGFASATAEKPNAGSLVTVALYLVTRGSDSARALLPCRDGAGHGFAASTIRQVCR